MSDLQRQLLSAAVLFPGITVERCAALLDVRTHTAASVAWSLRRLLTVDEFTKRIHAADWVTS